MRDDELAAAALGVDVFRTRLWAWVLSAAIMGIGGALFAEYNLAFDPELVLLRRDLPDPLGAGDRWLGT